MLQAFELQWDLQQENRRKEKWKLYVTRLETIHVVCVWHG